MIASIAFRRIKWLNEWQFVVACIKLISSITHNTSTQHTNCHRHLRSTNRNLLAVPRHRLKTYGGRAFAVAGPTVWNSLPDFIRDPSICSDSFRRLLKTYLFALYYSACSALEVDNFMSYINLLTYLLTYLLTVLTLLVFCLWLIKHCTVQKLFAYYFSNNWVKIDW